MTERILIFDTTLRDGEQSPGCSMNTKEKVELAKQLARLGVDVLEAGFPIASQDDFEAVRAVAQSLKDGPVIAGLARAKDTDIDRAWEAVQAAQRPESTRSWDSSVNPLGTRVSSRCMLPGTS